MRTSKLALWAMTICLLLITGSSPAHASATLTESGQIAATKADIREVVADNAALVAEVAAVRESLASERQSTTAMIAELNRYTAASEEERRLLREQNSILAEMNETLQKQVRAEKQKGIGKLLLGLVVGGAIGAVAAH
ncbi:hypothetical protein [Cloacibacillus porcorum]|uniref:hypothetical protein n=1 Tax=Cloacibacillus porcorum TaxID=1197717 RepID=UPI0023F29742|nr:hypothetical protein [Cloacibacillus porcorum]MCC8185026.1 hypothetical protein [Cloacibacillus porcorum]